MGETGPVTGTLDRGREAFRREEWTEATTALMAADRAAPLPPSDLERLALALFLVGRADDSTATWTRAHHGWLDAGDPARAARCAFWLAFGIDMTGTQAPAAGWFERARRLADEAGHDCVEQGYVLVPGALRALMVTGDVAASDEACARIVAIGDRFRDPDLSALGRIGAGHARVLLGDRAGGVALLDEAMVAVTAAEVSPQVAGIVYCAVIGICQETFDVRRARDWTEALTRWCAAHPDVEPFRGNCRVHRAEILQLDGAWADALAEAEQAYERLSRHAGDPAVGDACYQRGELHRLRGEDAAAEDAFRQASHWGRPPQPGLALLRLAQGRLGPARAAIDRAVAEATDPPARARLLAAQGEIALAAGDVPAARTAADELGSVAEAVDVPYLTALAAHAAGAVLLAGGDAPGALAVLRPAHAAWQALGAPYEAARTRVLLGRGYRALGDQDGAALEIDAAAGMFRRLGAEPDLAALDRAAVRSGGHRSPAASGLSPREMEVLGELATGHTNREIAADLGISEKTVARHVSNIFAKLGLSSRSAATAYAYEHELVGTASCRAGGRVTGRAAGPAAAGSAYTE
jgi:DNA-binding CsgD family transcriptional regulator